MTVCGGGANSSEWTQILADVLNSPLHTTEASQVAARGAVIGARLAAGTPTGAEWIAETKQIDPDPARAAFYDEGFAHYLRRSEAARPRWLIRPPLCNLLELDENRPYSARR